MMRSYTELPGLAAVVLEDSYVLGIEARPGTLIFAMEYVLAVDHEQFTAPPPGKQYVPRRGTSTSDLRSVPNDGSSSRTQPGPVAVSGAPELAASHAASCATAGASLTSDRG